ncbi:MAG TPA: hypothetical protein VFG86_13575, partial [Chloroflexota bacterium]|nr:hypothetical protein [Chloroflexota bacterium]
MAQSQFGDPQLSSEEAYAACGPAAAIRWAQVYGRNPSLREATDLAKQVGWTPQQGMAGISSEQQLLARMGVDTRIVQRDWDAFGREAQTGNPVMISTPGHYFFADSYNPQTGQFHVGRSGLDLRDGKEWMTADEMERRMGTAQGALFANNPNVASDSTASTTAALVRPATRTTTELSGGGPAGALDESARSILSGAADIAAWLGEQGQKALQSILLTEGGLSGARGDQGASAGPLQFYGTLGSPGQLNNFARERGISLEAARAYVEHHPLEAIQWAIGTPDAPGYLGRAIKAGEDRGLTGPDLATHAQRTGQVSVSPERAGQNFNALFGVGQDLVRAAQTATGEVLRQSEDVLGQVRATAQDLGTRVQQAGQNFLEWTEGFRAPVTATQEAAERVGSLLPDITGALRPLDPFAAATAVGERLPTFAPTLPPESPVARAARGETLGPGELVGVPVQAYQGREQAVRDLVHEVLPNAPTAVHEAVVGALDPLTYLGGPGVARATLAGRAGGPVGRDIVRAMGGDQTAQTVGEVVGSLIGGFTPAALERAGAGGALRATERMATTPRPPAAVPAAGAATATDDVARLQSVMDDAVARGIPRERLTALQDQIDELVRTTQPPSAADKGFALWYAALLSNPVGRIRDVISNALTTAMAIPETAAAAAIETARVPIARA